MFMENTKQPPPENTNFNTNIIPIRKAPIVAFSYSKADHKSSEKPMLEIDLRPLPLSPIALAEAARVIAVDIATYDPQKIVHFKINAVAQ